ncbi:MAG: porphobilinogen synthase [Magnetococcales bacterium]|nr:porphobilinogen synthase [Magnetococcales bacterium]
MPAGLAAGGACGHPVVPVGRGPANVGSLVFRSILVVNEWSPLFPGLRLRRLRRTESMRRMVRETWVRPEHLILPLFVVPGSGVRKPVASMPGVEQRSIDETLPLARAAHDAGLGGVILFGIPEQKDPLGEDACREDGIVQRAIRQIKAVVPELFVISDLCFCEYTAHGHCGVINAGEVDNDATLERLGQSAVTHARAGVDMVAPSGMMDGMVKTLRQALDTAHYPHLPIMSYAAKYASAFYGPFREAAESTPQFGDRRGYQMDPANRREALREVGADVAEGADIVMVKPGLAYLDILREVRSRFDLPLAVYNVSGEYAMVKAAASQGWIDEDRTVLEIMTAFRRAGADMILTYHALHVAHLLQG